MTEQKNKNKYLAAVVLQVVIIIFIVIYKLLIMRGGSEIILHIKPVDPRSPLRGDYITFDYDISSIPYYLLSGDNIYNNDQVFVLLNQTGKYWIVDRVQKIRPVDQEQIFLKAVVVSGGVNPNLKQYPNDRYNPITVQYGIEEYFIPEGKGGTLPRNMEGVSAKVLVNENGQAQLKQIFIGDRPWP
ncbi:MAG: putative conserved membrane protein [Microgenomates group bacterium GW2011_GWC1_37_8]|uniref:Putative conserved membrane protein n=1 Tax=Candidatus Woesebacteria bacterium GW2011_GWB1_38_8 TaxID=1618570 RepID=A0A0G0P5Z6_9BACT|nr:MAG: putative conserved membrane protein [Microgenomates group bacterium GW2011_GWC1_37_8]KKQ84726.1 MAG: putative conserved membrane protein [Candidatus Woesebacteria bacterium GW2011_GWB1_38_8]